MLRRILPAFFLLLIGYAECQSQACTTLGQNPSTAFPICGLDTFKQQIVPNCGGKTIPVPGCNDVTYSDLNPFWYKFTCFISGTLGFTIVPVDQTDDYDWQLFDITGQNPEAVYTNPSLFVAGNWSGHFGNTGASASGTGLSNCAGDYPIFSSMPEIIEGHNYILLLSHFTTFDPGQDGYSLFFGGGTASIVDPVKPEMVSANANCSGQTVYVGLSKKLRCTSLDTKGTDFILSPANAVVIAASGVNCNNSFDMDSIVLTLDKPLPPGNYSLIIQNGQDNNTLLDNCNNNVTPNSSIPFKVFPLAPTPMDSITPVQCSPDVLSLYFTKPISCNSIAANGSDFVVTGNPSISVVSASGDSCNNGLTNRIKVKLNKAVQNAGSFSIILKTGTDGNTLLDECVQQTPVGSTLSFITVDTVSATFNYSLKLGCVFDTLFYAHAGGNGVNKWEWFFDTSGTSHSKDSFFVFKNYGTKHIRLYTDNGVCSDSSSVDILLDNELISRFHVTPSAELCPEDAIQFTDSSTGKIVSWYWVFGDGSSSTLQTPSPKKYPSPPTRNGRIYPAALIVQNNIGCFDTAQAMIKVLYNCYIAVPTAFTPNSDGLNDYLYPINAYKADNLQFLVYNRWGQLVFETKDWTKKWNGKINGNPQSAGTYVWMLRYKNRDTGELFSLKGTTVLIR